jgi:hypothetical protein
MCCEDACSDCDEQRCLGGGGGGGGGGVRRKARFEIEITVNNFLVFFI